MNPLLQSPVWKQMRAEITPMFTTMRLKGLTELMNLNSVELVNKIQRDYIDHNKPVDVKVCKLSLITISFFIILVSH